MNIEKYIDKSKGPNLYLNASGLLVISNLISNHFDLLKNSTKLPVKS